LIGGITINKIQIVALSCILLFITPSIQTQKTDNNSVIFVDDDNTLGPWDGSIEHPFFFIQDAINAAIPYDTIFIFNGIYYENIIIKTSISLIGEEKENTIIDGDNRGGVISVEDGNSILITNFTIQHGIDTTEKRGYGISSNTSNDVRIISNIITNNEDGIIIQKKSQYCLIIQNEIVGNELGFDLCTSTNNLIYENKFIDNTLGLILFNSSNNCILKNIFDNGEKHIKFYNSYDTIYNNYWGKSRRIFFIFGYKSLFGTNLIIPWIRCDFKPARSIDAIESNPLAIMDTTKGKMIFELYSSKTPVTVQNFISLSNIDFYENIVFHRVIDDFVIQGGGYYSNGTDVESPLGTIDLEIHPEVRHEDGAISMARTNDPNSATSQFFICDGKQTHLDDNYAAFGTLLVGFSVLRAIASVETETKYGFMKDWPVDNIEINWIDILNK